MATTPTTTASQEDAKNMALLFFMDHLMQKNGRRTIHDLSCQFGARGFTQEMREAVGATQEGLSEFLTQYPSLFTIEGDSVSMKGYGDLSMGGAKASPLLQSLSRDRDYEKEAIEFFEEKLHRFGPELQIKSLLGHRSQAAPEIRIVSGRHVKDFSEFLSSQPFYFVVEGDRVRLKNMPEPTTQNEGDFDENGLPLSGVRAKQTAVDYLKNFVETQEAPVPMDALYKQFCNRFSHIVRQEVATNPKELLQFLKLNRHIFFIRSNKVSIVRNRDVSNGDSPLDSCSIGSANDGDNSSTDGNPKDQNIVDILELITVIKSLKAAQSAVAEIASIYAPGSNPPLSPDMYDVVAVDFKVVSLGPQEFITLVVLGAANGKLYVFDVAHSSSILVESGLKELLEAEDFIKVIHDCKRISILLSQQYNIGLQNVFDTQIANAVLQHQRTNRPLHEVKPVSFLTLQRLYHPQSLMYSDVSPRKISKKDPRFWSIRPMTDEMIQIAVEEARFLIPFIFQSMNQYERSVLSFLSSYVQHHVKLFLRAFKPEMRSLFEHLCDESASFSPCNQNENPNQQLRFKKNRSAVNFSRDNNELSPETNGRKTNDYIKYQKNSFDENGKTPSACCDCKCHQNESVDIGCQTLSTGDIGILEYFAETRK